MIHLKDIFLQLGDRILFDDLDIKITEKDKIGLVGKNGAGKTTLLKIIAEDVKPDGGKIDSANSLSIGFLPQHLKITDDKSVLEIAKQAFDKQNQIQQQIDDINKQLLTRKDYESETYLSLIDQLNEKTHQLNVLDVSKMDEKIERVLAGLGFEHDDMAKNINTFSGGWQMRVYLAKILLENPSVLLLDEPTNHLDIESIIWLEQFLKEYVGAVILVSHDKTFLDNVTNRTVELVKGKAYDYKCAYTKFVQLREERIIQQTQEKKNQDKYKKQLERNVERFRAKKNKAKFAQTLIRKLDKMEDIELDDTDQSAFNIRFNQGQLPGKWIFQTKSISKSYGDVEVIKQEEFEINRGERVAFVGKNGTGKTTLSRILAGDLNYHGELEIGHNVNYGFFAQHQAQGLDGDKTVFDTIDEAATGEMRTRVRSLLGSFLFSGDDIEKKVKVLSGGEKVRLALAKLLLDPYNVLILDEPTNHLDIPSKNRLKDALNQYEGTVILVSHDRDFLADLTNRIFEFTAQGIKHHQGSVNEFLANRKVETFRELELDGRSKSSVKKADSSQKLSYQEKKEREKTLQKLKNQLSKIERQIVEMEQKIQAIETDLTDPEVYAAKVNDREYFATYEQHKQDLEQFMERWEELGEEIEAYDS